ncbi:constitutive photomorphogenesis protein 10-like isoform X2 [Pyrus x bretschneideri]|uniref:constitutive photomorphogenesis protein 10-like isoform X2 n=1 Tax=Pyrus x bretschneideri TaxID=225117 RepID=UPI00202E3AA2|nr:constitutive photomorphogenesis protein 10-like isoform X2 [Pyrus x bretschneideri]
MDRVRAVIVGTEATPYHDGLFFFDVCFPSDYPNVPPEFVKEKVHERNKSNREVEALTNQLADQQMLVYNLASKILCWVINVSLKAEPDTDEVFAQVTLLPEANGVSMRLELCTEDRQCLLAYVTREKRTRGMLGKKEIRVWGFIIYTAKHHMCNS